MASKPENPMNDDPVSLHERAAELFSARVHAVPVDGWAAPTPCPEWSVRELVNHLVNEELWMPELLAGRTIAEVGDRFDGDLVGDDPVGAWDDATARARAAVAQEGAMQRIVHLSFGDFQADFYTMQVFSDLLVHSWDLARAIGADDDLPDDLVTACFTFNRPQEETLRRSGLFGPHVEVPPDADEQTRLLALVGRRS